MARKSRLKALRFALETAYGVDAIAGGETTFDLKGRDVSIVPMAGDEIELNYDDGTLGGREVLLTGTHVTASFKTDLIGSGTPDQPAPWSALMQACLRKTTTNADNVTYTIDTGSDASLTMYYFQDGARHALVGVRGSVKLTAKTGEIPSLEWAITGLYSPPSSLAQTTLDTSAWLKPLPLGNAHSSFSLNGVARKLISIEMDQANTVAYQEYVGFEAVEITDFKPTCTIVIEAPDRAEFDPIAIAESEVSNNSMSLQHGGTPGNIVQFNAGKMQFGRPSYGDQDGTLTWSIPLKLIGEDGTFITK